jgi:MoaA/NifB/PqqE/SkfB family radical SAM enzyme
MSNNKSKILKASSYYLEDVRGFDLEDRAQNGNLSFILLNQPPICDYHCRRCFMPDYRRQNYSQKQSLTLQDYEKILKDAGDNGIICLELSGEGEPLLSRDLQKIIKSADRNGLMTTLITNGNTIDEKRIAYYRNHNVTLVFSLHTLDKSKYEQDNRCSGSFERKIEHIKRASEIYSGTKKEENGFEVYRLAIHTTLQRDNIGEIEQLKHFCHNWGIFFSIAPLALVGSALEHPEIYPQNGEKLIDEVVFNGDNSIIHSHSSKKVFGREVCGTAFYGLNIGWDGAILFDAH